MADVLPKWLMKKYATLWQKFHDRKFTREEAEDILDNPHLVNIILFELRHAGWLETYSNPDDSRKRFYKLKTPQDVTKEIEV